MSAVGPCAADPTTVTYSPHAARAADGQHAVAATRASAPATIGGNRRFGPTTDMGPDGCEPVPAVKSSPNDRTTGPGGHNYNSGTGLGRLVAGPARTLDARERHIGPHFANHFSAPGIAILISVTPPGPWPTMVWDSDGHSGVEC